MVERQFINGHWVASKATATYEQRNPADLRVVTGTWPQGNEQDADAAIAAAAAAFPAWRALPAIKRADLFRAALAEMDRRREEIARIITVENGKPLKDSRAEVQSAYREMEYQIGEGVRLGGALKPTAQPGVMAFETREPLGVVAVIAPWNFPFNVPGRKATPALMAGNTVVFKPAGLTPGVGKAFVELFAAAGFPPGVINMVVGGGTTVGARFSSAPAIKAISFTGSTAVGRQIHRTAAAGMIRTQLEMGGKNAVVVLADADMTAAVDSVVTSAYACAGQWCTSTSRVIVEQSCYGDFVEAVRARVAAMRTGNGLDDGVDMGPVCGEQQALTVADYLDVGRREGARLVVGGTRLTAGDCEHGSFIAPTVFADVQPQMRIAREEIFGPVLSIMPVADYAAAVELTNAVDYGLAASIYTNDLQRAHDFVARADVGLVHVNMLTAYKEPAFAFGGVKDSGFGLPEAGTNGIQFFTEHKVAYIKYA